MNDGGSDDVAAAAVTELTRVMQTGERIAAALRTLELPISFLTSLSQSDEELSPEIAVAMAHLREAAEAMGRAFEFANARYAVRLDALIPDAPTSEGDTT